MAREARLTDEDVYWGMVLGAAELLGNGVTTTCEQYRHPAPVLQALEEAGIRAVYTPGIFEVPGSGPGKSWEHLLAETCALFDAAPAPAPGWRWDSARTRPTPSRPRASAPSPPRPSAAARCYQIHLAETEAECEVVRGRHGMSAPALLASVGALDGRVLAAHAVWLDEADLELLAAHDVAVAHCPGSNGKLGAGVAPLRALLDRGVRVGLGTDGPASNDDLDLWDEMRLAALFARAGARDPEALSSAAALRLATRGGAEALGLRTGALEPGRPADLVRVRTDDARFTPSVTPAELLGHLVWAGAGFLVTDVWVGGVQAVADGRCARLDEERARLEVGRRARRLAGS